MAWKWIDRLRGIEGRVYELSGEEYILTKDEMQHKTWYVSKSEVQRALASFNAGGNFALRYTTGGRICFATASGRWNGGIKVGCQYFDSPEASKVRKWAKR